MYKLDQYTLPILSDEIIRSKPYPLPFSTQKVVKQEIETILKMGVIERSDLPYALPKVLVMKEDGANRFCVDFRRLNKVAMFDPKLIPNADDLMPQVAEGRYFTKIDLAKEYWQIPLAEEDKYKTAFVTHEGHYHFKVMPFGIINASAVFTRMILRLLDGLPNVINYTDDILIILRIRIVT